MCTGPTFVLLIVGLVVGGVVGHFVIAPESGGEMAATEESASGLGAPVRWKDRKSTRLNSSHKPISYAVFCLQKKKK